MKAITLWQPWATLAAVGLKRFETRSWSTNYTGPLAIHAAKRSPKLEDIESILAAANRDELFSSRAAARRATNRRIFNLESAMLPTAFLPLGCVVAVVRLGRCRQTDELSGDQNVLELACGDWDTGRFAWELLALQRLVEPIPTKGAQGLWDWDDQTGVWS